jgi:hypothetical protein
MAGDLQALLFDTEAPARAAQFGLETPFEEMQQQDGKATGKFALFGLAMLSISSATCSKSTSPNLPARNNAACSFAQA